MTFLIGIKVIPATVCLPAHVCALGPHCAHSHAALYCSRQVCTWEFDCTYGEVDFIAEVSRRLSKFARTLMA